MWLVTVAARSSWLPTRTMAARSQSPATESTSQVISKIAAAMCAPDGPRPPPGGRLLVCVPGGYSTPSTIEPAASGRRRFSDVRHMGRVPGAAPGKGPRSKHRSTPWLARNEVALPARAVAHLECGATDRRAGDQLGVILRSAGGKLDRAVRRHDLDRHELAVAQHGDLAPAGMRPGQDQFASGADGSDPSPVVEGAA